MQSVTRAASSAAARHFFMHWRIRYMKTWRRYFNYPKLSAKGLAEHCAPVSPSNVSARWVHFTGRSQQSPSASVTLTVRPHGDLTSQRTRQAPGSTLSRRPFMAPRNGPGRGYALGALIPSLTVSKGE